MTRTFFSAIVLLLACSMLQSCYKDDDSPEEINSNPVGPSAFNGESYDLGIDATLGYGFSDKGNSTYSVHVGDNTIVSTRVEVNDSVKPRSIMLYVHGLRKGTTSVTMVNNRTGEQGTLNLRVTDPYTTLVADSGSTAFFPKDAYLFLAKKSKRYYFYTFQHYKGQALESSAMAQGQGTFAFTLEDGKKVFLTLTSTTGEIHHYDLSDSSIGELYLLGKDLDFNYEATKEDIRQSDSRIRLKETWNGTTTVIRCYSAFETRIPLDDF